MNKKLLVFIFALTLIISQSVVVLAEDEASSTPLVDPITVDSATSTDPIIDPVISSALSAPLMGPMILPPLPPPSPTATLDVYTIDNLIIAPKDTSSVLATTSSIDLDFSSAVTASLDILDSSSTLIKNIYNWASVTHPTPKIWYGKDDADNFVADGTYTVQVVYSDAGGTATDTSKTIIVDNDVPIVGAITITPSFAIGGTTYISTLSELSVSVADEGTGVRDCNFGYDNGAVNYWPDVIVPSTGNCVLTGVDTSDPTITKIIVQAYDNFLHSQGAEQVVTVDNLAPILTLLGNSTINLKVGETYTEAGATALDTVFGDVTADITISGSVNTAIAGTYTLTYNVTDSLGNVATPVTRTVIVERGQISSSGGYLPGWGPNGYFGSGQVLGTSTAKVLGSSTNKFKELAKQKKLRHLKRKWYDLQIKLYNLKHPQAVIETPVVEEGTALITPTVTGGNSQGTSTGGEPASSSPAKTKPFWKFW